MNYTMELFPYKTDKFWKDDNEDHNGWNVLSEFFNSDEGKKLANELKIRYGADEKIFPAQENIFRAFELTAFKEVKVVILGQDPYPDERADGLCFSQKINSNKNDSLKQIFSVLGINDGNRQLDGWARQGVLLLNTILTVRGGEKVRDNAGSHKKIGWKNFTKKVILSLLNNNKDIVFVLLGKHAVELFNSVISNIDYGTDKLINSYNYKQYKLTNTTNQSKFFIVESPHPVSHLFMKFIKENGSPFDFDKKFNLNYIIKWERHHIE